MRKSILSSVLAGILAVGAMAQEAAPQPAAPQTQASIPQEITRAVHGDWQIKCNTQEQAQCYLFQLILGENGSPILEYSMVPAKIDGVPDATLGATMVAPLNVVLPRGIILQVDEKDPQQKVYNWCAQIGCYARFALSADELASYKNGSKLTAVLFAINNPNVGREINLSLNGFGAAYDELLEIEAASK